VATVQGLGGTGALKIGADFLKHLNPNAKVLISDPSWENHRALFTQAGFPVGTYRYYDAATRQLDCRHAGRPEGRRSRHHRGAARVPQPHRLRHQRRAVGPGDCRRQGARPHALPGHGLGFADGIAEDGAVIGKFVAAGLTFFVSTSFSKSFSLYGERVGALSVLCADKDEAAACSASSRS
jgi:aromatic-amino-acid transaminase